MAEDKDHIDYYGLLSKYLIGEASDQEVDQLEKWVLSSPENEAQFRAFKKAWVLSGVEGDYQNIEVEEEWGVISEQLFPVSKAAPLQVGSRRRFYKVLGVAATIAVLLVAAAGLYRFWSNQSVAVIAQNEVENKALPDGTQVSLNQYATLTFSNDRKEGYRKVELTGDAFFEVEKDVVRPFRITTPGLQIEVLGTSFYVDAREDQPNTEVIVASGTVAVTSGNQRIVVQAGETGIYDKSAGRLSKQTNENINYLAWKTDVLVFDGTKLESVVFDLNRKFHAGVTIAGEEIKNCEITATFKDQSLPAIVRVIEQTLKIEANTDGDRIVFSGQSCG